MLRRQVLGTALAAIAALIGGCREVQDDVADELVGEAPEAASLADSAYDVERVEDGARFTVSGTVRNLNDRDIDEVEVTAVLLDDAQSAIRLESTVVEWVPASGTKDFDLSFTVSQRVYQQFDSLTVGMQFPD